MNDLQTCSQPRRVWRHAGQIAAATALLWCAAPAPGAVPSAEKLLPDDTLVLLTAPDVSKLREAGKQMPLTQCWNDPAMKPFRDKFLEKWHREVIQPLERELNIKLSDYTSLLQGQLTFAVTQDGWQGQPGQEPGILLLLDTKDKTAVLKKNLADLRKKWVDSGKPLRTQRIRDIEFIRLPVSTNDVPKTLRKMMSSSAEVQELGDDSEKKKTESSNELVLGQYESLLLAGSSMKALEKVAARLTGGTVPSLGETAAYQADHAALFRDAPLYGWVNAKPLFDVLVRALGEKKENPDAPNPFDVKPEKIVSALGLSGLKTLAVTFQQNSDGMLFRCFIGVPEPGRQGLFKILAGEPKDCNPLPFVPADAVKFTRWRIDGQKAWGALQKLVGDISPQWLNGINFILDTANTAARDKDPSFDIRKNLIGNLGDDFISYQKAPKGTTLAELSSPPSLFLIGSPQPEQLAAALKSVLVYVSEQSAPPQEREFLGRKIYSVPLRPMGMGGSPAGANSGASLHYAAGGSYLALAADATMLEEFLRSSDAQTKSLRELPGFAEAAQKVGGPGACLLGFQNSPEIIRGIFETLRKQSGGGAASGLQTGLGVPAGDETFKEWVDFSLLPPFEKVSKYFYITVYGGSATTEGLTFRAYDPVPPLLKGPK